MSCQAIYHDTLPDGSRYAHTCSPEVVEHATFDPGGKQLTPERRYARPIIRNENWAADSTEENPRIISEGKGRIVDLETP